MSKSHKLATEARKFTPAGIHSNFRLAPEPAFYVKASGSKLYDADGRIFIDYALGMGPAILGHAPLAVVQAVKNALDDGQLYGGQHPAEIELARKVCELVPCAERVRFALTGTESIQAAIRLARAHTGRTKILKFEGHYHGWADNIYVSVRPTLDAAGPSEKPIAVAMTEGQDPWAFHETHVAPWNDVEALHTYLERYGDETAAIICEPIGCNTCVIPPDPAFLDALRSADALLIFDEVITGFRVALGGAQEMLGVTPDLAVFAKAVATGFPISILAGRAQIMERLSDGKVMHGGTFNSNVISTSAALATLRELERPQTYETITERGGRLMDGLRAMGLHVQGLPGVFNTTFTQRDTISNYREYIETDLPRQAAFVDALEAHGVHTTPRGTWFLSTAHSDEDIDATLQAASSALGKI